MAAFETFENAFDQTWSDNNTPTDSFVNSGSHGGSTYHCAISGASGDYMYNDPSGLSGKIYLSGWFKVTTDSMADASTIDFIGVRDSGGNECATMVLVKTGTQLSVRLDYYDNGAQSTPTHNITAGTWYHFGIYYENGTDQYAWYLSTEADLGAAVESDATITTSRSPYRVRIGIIAGSGTFGSDSTVIGFDSFDVDASSLVHNAEDSSATPVSVDADKEIGVAVQNTPTMTAVRNIFDARKHVRMIFGNAQ